MLASLEIYTDENVDIDECIKRLTLYAEILTPDEMKNRIEFL